MSFLALHRSEHTSLASSSLWLAEDELTHAEAARQLLQQLQALLDGRRAELTAARAAAAAEGLAAGRAEALRTLAPRLADAWDQAARSASADLAAVRAEVVTLALQVVQHVADQLAPADVVAALAERAAQALLPDAAAVVRVHPDVADAVRERLAGAAGVLSVRADPQLGRHDCAFDTPAGQLLAGLAMQLRQVRQALQGPA